jgi:ParB family chromosome partitioning protein
MSSNKLSAKAAKLDFSHLPGAGAVAVAAAAESSGAARPKTAPGAMMAFANDARSELMRENDELRERAREAEQLRGKLGEALGDLQQWQGAKAARLIDARQVVASPYANRHEINFSGPAFAALRAEIEGAGGNVQPIKVRAVAAGEDGQARYEVVFGHRRHRACLELGLPVLAVIDNLDDRALFVEMDRENRARKDLSAWEQGMMYRRALKQGLYPSNRKLAEAVGVDLSALGKALALADLPEVVVAAFASPLALQFRWAKPLADAYAAAPQAVTVCAQTLAQGSAERKPRQVLASLLAAAGQGVEPFHPPEPLAVEVDGQQMARVTLGAQGTVTVTIEAGCVADAQLPTLAKLLQQFLAGVGRRGGRLSVRP